MARTASAYARSKKTIDKKWIDTKWVKAHQKNFGWVELTLISPHTMKETTFNVRPSMVKEAIEDARGSMWKTSQGVLYSKFIRTTVKGQQYSDRRHVEGIIKVANDTKNEALIEEVTAVLKHSDAYVSNWYHNVWLRRMSGAELEIFYDGSDDSIETELTAMGVVFDEE